MSPLGTRRSVEELARLLDGGVTSIVSPATAGGATAGVLLAGRIRAMAPAFSDATTPRPEFRTALRTRLVAVAGVQAAAAPPAVPWVRRPVVQRRLGVTAGAVAGVVAFAGVGIASSRSVPGEAFYGLKRGAEGVQLDLASGNVAKGRRHLQFASTRLREVQALAQSEGALSLGAGSAHVQAGGLSFGADRAFLLHDTLGRMDSDTRTGSKQLLTAFRASGQRAPLELLATWAAGQRTALERMMPMLPPSAQPSARSSLALVTAVGGDAAQVMLLGTCSNGCDPRTSGPSLGSDPAGGSGLGNNGVPRCSCTGGPVPVPPAAPVTPPASTGSTGVPGPTPSGVGTSAGPAPSSPGPAAPGPLPTPIGSGLPVPGTPPLPTLPVAPPAFSPPAGLLPAPLLSGPSSPLPTGLPLPG